MWFVWIVLKLLLNLVAEKIILERIPIQNYYSKEKEIKMSNTVILNKKYKCKNEENESIKINF